MKLFARKQKSRSLRLAAVILLLAAFLSNSTMLAYAAEGAAGDPAGYSFAINGAEFTLTPDTAPYLAASDGRGSVEIATEDAAVIWTDLGGAGSGALTEGMLEGLEGVDYSLSGNRLTVAGYPITVRDDSASGTPVADGSTTTYDFRDGSVVSTLYQAHPIGDGKSVSSSDKLLTLTGNNNISYNGGQHGIQISRTDTVSVKVAGNAAITLSLCAYAAGDGAFTVSGTSDGTISPSTVTAKVTEDGNTATVAYEGAATTLTFTYSGGSGYIHWISVANEAEETDITEQKEMPSVGKGSDVTVTPTGQRLAISQSGGSLSTSGSSTPEGVGYYGFAPTSDLNALEADVTVTDCGGSSAYGIFLGAYDLSAQRIAVAGIRNSTNLRCVFSNPNNDYYLGAGGFNETIRAGETVHIQAVKTADRLSVTMTTDGGGEYTADLPYTNSENCQLGFVVANAAATVTNMVYKTEGGTVLYDQNDCYAPVGQAPVVTAVEAAATGTREAIMISWRISAAASGDGYYLVEAQHDDGPWTEIARTTETSYTYPISEGGIYRFRVSGGLGESGQGTSPVISEPIDILRALETPVLTAEAGADRVTLSWDAVAGAASYDVYRTSHDAAVQLLYTASEEETSYTDTAVTAEVPYYYYITARSAGNWSNPSPTVWAMPSAGHTGAYLPAEESAHFTLTQGAAETVFSDALTLAGTVDRAGVVRAYLDGTQLGDDQTVSAGGSFSYDLTLAQGGNTVTLILTDTDGGWSRAVYNYYYLPMNSQSVGGIVDAAYTGVDGAQDTNGIPNYRTVQAAVNAVPMNNPSETVIFVRAGDYEERLVVDAPNITLIGEGENTRIHCYPADLYENPDPNQPGYEAGGDMTMRCATYIQSTALNFHAENLSFANDYVYDSVQTSNQSADALRCDADGARFVNVTISGVQDTLYLHQGVQTFTNCRIEGLIDFIYSGDKAQVLFNDCEIVFVYIPTHAESGIICAPRTAADADCGLVFYRCSVTAEEGCAGGEAGEFYLARPWGADAAVYWIDCYMSGILYAALPYDDMSGNSYQDARFYECGSYGPGYTVNGDRRQIARAQAQELLAIFGAADEEPLPGAPVSTQPPETPDAPSGGGSSGGGSSSGRPNASVSGTGGTVSASSSGTVTITPDEGYQISSITVNGKAVAIPANGRLTGLDRNDEVIVTFERIPEEEPEPAQEPFADVTDGAWYADAVQYVYDNGLMTGVSGSSFAPNNTLTRAMVVQTLYAMAGKPEVSGSESFADVASNDWFADAVTWASANGIVNGYSAAQFAPGDPVTREQLALILYGYAQIRGYNTTQGGMSIREFSDYGAISDWALEAMDWAVNAGLLSGKGNGVLDPAGTATRAEVAQILMNFCENIAR